MRRSGLPISLFWMFCAVYAIAVPAMEASPQTPSTGLSFEVATIKPVDFSLGFDGTHHWAHIRPAGASYWAMRPIDLIAYAYDVEQYQVACPEWAKDDSFDIEARFPEGADPKDDRRMLQALLKDRLKLAFHIEKKPSDVYALVVGPHGGKLKPSPPDPVSIEPDSSTKPKENNAGGQVAPPKIIKNPDGSTTMDFGKRGSETFRFDEERWLTHDEASKMSMEEMAERLSGCLGTAFQKVVNETGLTGTYQLAWDCPLGTGRPPRGGDGGGTQASDLPDGASLSRSLDALGLKLEKRKILQNRYVVDHIERPSEN